MLKSKFNGKLIGLVGNILRNRVTYFCGRKLFRKHLYRIRTCWSHTMEFKLLINLSHIREIKAKWWDFDLYCWPQIESHEINRIFDVAYSQILWPIYPDIEYKVKVECARIYTKFLEAILSIRCLAHYSFEKQRQIYL